ncbi:MAG TPA: LysR family transcriptional regulator [Dehalococcoidia bacterium]|nr:LysR family transcriptional regulator [Dehalococcoidia bacterium]
MNLEHLKTFQEVVRLGSFSEVAKKLAITQPAVSFQIQRLEQELGTRLIDRSRREITLTAAGKRLLHFAKFIEGERGQLQHDLEQLREEVSGELLIAASTIPGEFLLPGMLAKFKKMHPAVRVQVDISDSLAVIDGVEQNRYELGFCGISPEGHELTSLKVAEDRIVLTVFPEHPFARRDQISAGELEGESLIFRENTSGTQRHLESYLSREGLNLKKFKPILILGTSQAVVAAVEGGAGIAFVSNLAIKKSLVLGLIKQVRVAGLDLRRDFYCVYRKERVVTRLVEEFIDFVQLEGTTDVKRS